MFFERLCIILFQSCWFGTSTDLFLLDWSDWRTLLISICNKKRFCDFLSFFPMPLVNSLTQEATHAVFVFNRVQHFKRKTRKWIFQKICEKTLNVQSAFKFQEKSPFINVKMVTLSAKTANQDLRCAPTM